MAVHCKKIRKSVVKSLQIVNVTTYSQACMVAVNNLYSDGQSLSATDSNHYNYLAFFLTVCDSKFRMLQVLYVTLYILIATVDQHS